MPLYSIGYRLLVSLAYRMTDLENCKVYDNIPEKTSVLNLFVTRLHITVNVF